jgi:hypothetical protein
VDVDRTSEDPYTRTPFMAPLLVRTLIEEGSHPRVGHVMLEPGPKVIEVRGLAGLVRNENRKLPIVVFAHDWAGAEVTMARAEAAYRRLAGVAAIFVLPPVDVEEFKALVGEDLAVWGGGARLYLPNRGPGGLRPERHRYVPGSQAARFAGAAGEVISNMLAGLVPATPAPPDFEPVRHHLTGRAGRDLDELLEVADAENEALRAQVQELRVNLAARDDEIIDTIADNEELVAANNRLAAQVARLLAGSPPGVEVSGEPPDTVSTIEEAIEMARMLDGVVVHPGAPKDIEKLESAVNAGSWAGSIWRALRALDAYAADAAGADGFYNWCKMGESPWSWPATPKKLAMSESEAVMASPGLRGARILPVDVAVSPTGTTEMQAHIKIAEGGGPLAPRIYFYDDTAGKTGKMHVGFIGPHDHMPNRSTN